MNRETLSEPTNARQRTPGATRWSRLLLALACTSAVAMYLYGDVPYQEEPYRRWDLATYRAMAEASPSLAENESRHFAYRVLGPFLAGLVPSETLGFRVVTYGALGATVCLLALFLRWNGCSGRASALACVFFVLNKHAFGYPAWNFFHANDAIVAALLVLAFWAVYARRLVLLALVLLAGAVTRETIWLVVPIAVVATLERRGRPRDVLGVLMAALPALAATVALRSLLGVTGDTGLWGAFLRHAPKLADPESWLRLLGNAQAPFVLVPIVFAGTTLRFLRTRPHIAAYAVLAFASTLFGSNDERLMAPVFLVWAWLLSEILDAHPPGPWTIGGLLACAVLASLDHRYARYALPTDTYTRALTALAATGATALALAWRRSDARGARVLRARR